MPDREGAPRVIAELQELQTPNGTVWRVVSSHAAIMDHVWIERAKLHRLSEGAATIEFVWTDGLDDQGQPLTLRYSPELPVPDPAPVQPIAA